MIGNLDLFVRLWRDLGLRRAIEAMIDLADGVLFDLRHGVDTGRLIELESLDIDSPNREAGVWYEASRISSLRRAFAAIPGRDGHTFVDIGSGKGRALLLAHEAGFGGVVGIEFSPELVAIARHNAERFAGGQAPTIELIEGDAADYAFSPEQSVFHLYNPFDATIVSQVVDAIVDSLEAHPRPAYLLYTTPIHRAMIERHDRFQVVKTLTRGSDDTVVYLWTPHEESSVWVELP